MKQILINNKLLVSFPESFFQMDKEEKASLGADSDKIVALKSTELHIVVSIGWKNVDGVRGLFNKILMGNDPVKNMESFFQKRIKKYGYKKEEYLQCEAGGMTAEGLHYTYTSQGIAMTGESYVLKKEQTLYYLHCYYRTDLSQESRIICKQLLDSIQWK